jgi:glycosyltransferase involved in cell wall biosynthesis
VLVSIVVPAFNEERLLGRTLKCLRESTAVFAEIGWQSEVIVCDNNSTDRTAELATAAGAKVVFEPVNQIGRARNRGAEVAQGDWLIFVDADSLPSKELFLEVIDAIKSGEYLAGGCTVTLDADFPLGARVVRVWNWISRSFRLMAGSFIFCEAKAFREVGGFGQELFAGEELELSYKFKRLGRRLGRKMIILHRHPLVTSARKMQLYTPREFLWFFIKASLARRRVLTDRAHCYHWYDGRR